MGKLRMKIRIEFGDNMIENIVGGGPLKRNRRKTMISYTCQAHTVVRPSGTARAWNSALVPSFVNFGSKTVLPGRMIVHPSQT